MRSSVLIKKLNGLVQSRPNRLVLIAAAVALALPGGASAAGIGGGTPGAAANTVAAPAKPAKAWRVSCTSSARSAAPDCFVAQQLVAKDSGRLLSVATVEIPGSTRKPVLMLHLPSGLSIPAGVAIKVDTSTEIPVVLQFCDGSGCYATLAIDPALLTAMKAGHLMSVLATSSDGAHLAFQHLLPGFAASYKDAQ